MHHFTKYRHVIHCYHHYMTSRHITVTHACLVSLFLSDGSPCILHVVLFHVIRYSYYMIVSRYWYCYARSWLHELLICTVWNPTAIVSHFPLSCFMLSTELMSCYRITCTMSRTCSCYTIEWKIIKIIWVWGRLDGWLDHIGWLSGSIVCPTAGDGVVLATICYSWAPVSRYVLAHWDSCYMLQP